MTPNTKNTLEPKPEINSKKYLEVAAQRAYADHKKLPDKKNEITEYLPMIHSIVRKVVTYLEPPLTYEDLISAGAIGLIKAARDYDPSFQAEFKTYAYIRIKGAILDEIRHWSFLPPNVNKQINIAHQTAAEITDKTGNLPSDEQLAEKLQIPVEKLYQTFKNARAKHFISIDASREDFPTLAAFLPEINDTTPDQKLEQSELLEKLVLAIKSLNEKQMQIILLYYQQQLTMKQIAEILNVTEPRISQLHAGALFNLSIKLRQWKNG